VGVVGRLVGEMLQRAYATAQRVGSIGPDHRRARQFRAFGSGSAICFPVTALYGERYIRIGAGTIIGPHVTLSAGISPTHELGRDTAVAIGDRCLIGRGSGIVAHDSIEIGDDVFTGHHIYVTDANHGYEDPALPVGRQFGEAKPTTGPEVYKAYCSTCHGVDGQGGVGPKLAGVVAEKYPNIDDQIAVVTNGKGTMPSWRGRLTPQQIRRVVVYERTKLGQ